MHPSRYPHSQSNAKIVELSVWCGRAMASAKPTQHICSHTAYILVANAMDKVMHWTLITQFAPAFHIYTK